MAGSQNKRILLLHPPYADYTSPYHSLSYVAAAAKAAGFDVDVFDINALWFRSVFTQNRLAAWGRELTSELAQLNAWPSLSIADQERALDLIRAIALCVRIRPESAVDTLRSERFYDWEAYQQARAEVRSFEMLLNILYGPFDFFNAFALPPHEPKPAALVARAKASERLISDFAQILVSCCGGREYLFCGISVPYSANLLPAMALAVAAKRTFAETPRVAGGTAISDLFKYRNGPDALQPFSELYDLFYVGEAEAGIAALASFFTGESDRLPSQAIRLGASADAAPPMRYVSLAAVADDRKGHSPYDWRANPPCYDWIDWNLYLAPERRVI